jgi:hypothetical protein
VVFSIAALTPTLINIYQYSLALINRKNMSNMHPVFSAASNHSTISFDSIDLVLGEMARKADDSFNKAMKTFEDGDHSTASALAFQRESQSWKFSQDAVAKVTENFGDIMKSIIQKS